jgi:hypothetical protein
VRGVGMVRPSRLSPSGFAPQDEERSALAKG